jgi:iron complex outermembrane receptor protein
VRIAPTLKPAAQQYAALAAGAVAGGYRPPSVNPFDRLTDIDAALGVDTREGGVAAIADWKLANATITSVSAWRYWNWDAANDRDYTGIPIQLTQHIPSRQDQYSQELRIASNAPAKLEYVAGLYYFNQKILGHPVSIYGPTATYWLLPAGPRICSTAIRPAARPSSAPIATRVSAKSPGISARNWLRPPGRVIRMKTRMATTMFRPLVD